MTDQAIPFEWAAAKPIAYDDLGLDHIYIEPVEEAWIVGEELAILDELMEGAELVTSDLQEAAGRTLYYDPRLHPRDRLGRFRDVLASLKSGEHLRLADGTTIDRTPGKRSSFDVKVAGGEKFTEVGARKVAERVTDAVVARPRMSQDTLVELSQWPPAKGPAAQAVLGDAADTQNLHALRDSTGAMVINPDTGKPAYKPARVADVWAPIIASFFKDKTPPPKGLRRIAVFLAGGPASGKSSLLKTAAGKAMLPDEKHTIKIDPDAIKEMLPEWATLIGPKKNGGFPDSDRYTGFATHEESSDIAAQIRKLAMDNGYNVVIDGSGAGREGKFLSKLQGVHSSGYDVSVIYANAPTDTAWEGAQHRAFADGRWMPEKTLRDYHAEVSQRFAEIASADFLAGLEVYEAGTWDGKVAPKRLAHLDKDGRVAVDDKAGFQTFLDKADERTVVQQVAEPTQPKPPRAG